MRPWKPVLSVSTSSTQHDWCRSLPAPGASSPTDWSSWVLGGQPEGGHLRSLQKEWTRGCAGKGRGSARSPGLETGQGPGPASASALRSCLLHMTSCPIVGPTGAHREGEDWELPGRGFIPLECFYNTAATIPFVCSLAGKSHL